MESSTIALIATVIALIGSVVGAFAWLTGEMNKKASQLQRNLDNLRDLTNGRIDGLARNEQLERQTMRNDFVNSIQRVEGDLRRLSEAMVRRPDVDALESRVVRAADRLEQKFDAIMSRRDRGLPHGGLSD
jgi:hypothetical protein